MRRREVRVFSYLRPTDALCFPRYAAKGEDKTEYGEPGKDEVVELKDVSKAEPADGGIE